MTAEKDQPSSTADDAKASFLGQLFQNWLFGFSRFDIGLPAFDYLVLGFGILSGRCQLPIPLSQSKSNTGPSVSKLCSHPHVSPARQHQEFSFVSFWPVSRLLTEGFRGCRGQDQVWNDNPWGSIQISLRLANLSTSHSLPRVAYSILRRITIENHQGDRLGFLLGRAV